MGSIRSTQESVGLPIGCGGGRGGGRDGKPGAATGLTQSAGRGVASISYPRSSAMSPASRIAVSSVTRFNHNVIGLSRSSAGM
jgi:hypothetical protein